MTIHSRYIGILAFLLGITTLSYSQVAPELSQNRAVLRYLSATDVVDLESQNPEQYSNLEYYFTQSFTVNTLQPSQPLDLNEFFNYDLFNVKNFEHLRQQNDEVEITYREKYIVILKSGVEVDSHMTLSLEEITQKPLRPLPLYFDNGGANEDFEAYKRELEIWSKDFPEKFRLITSQNLVPKIPIAEYMMMSVQKKDQLNSVVDGYILIE